MAETRPLRKGDEGPQVQELQQMLIELGLYRGQTDGVFGPGTEKAVLAFQKDQGLAVDGVVGPRTWENLYSIHATELKKADEAKASVKQWAGPEEPPSEALKVEGWFEGERPVEPPSPPPTEPPQSATGPEPEPTPTPEYYTTFHRAFPEGVRWRLTPEGVEVEGSGVERMEEDAETVFKIWGNYGDSIRKWAERYQVVDVLIVATIAAETRGEALATRGGGSPDFTSAGLMQTSLRVARDLLKDPTIDESWLLEPDHAIQAGTAYIDDIRDLTLLDPPKVAAVTATGIKYHDPDPINRWRMGITAYVDHFVRYFNEAVRMRPSAPAEGVPYDIYSTEAVKDLFARKRPLDAGPSTHLATDRWTVQDALGYWAYADVIARFITHDKTKAPLTISIQAPWGGGKTSLMHMVQERLDPQGVQEALAEKGGETAVVLGETSVQTVLAEIDKTLAQKKTDPLFALLLPKTTKLTVWFNAWKYESTNQVWAGLVDAILHQVAGRLTLPERELFWLRLNLKRVDVDKVRRSVQEKIWAAWWQAMRGWLAGLAGVGLAAAATLAAGYILPGLAGLGLSGIAGIIQGSLKLAASTREVESKPAAVSLGDYLEIPNYRAELGFIHQVAADLERVLACVPEANKPLVIFIDDLDRCSPTKVAQVMEAVNLFLAGEFPQCMFVLGMDAEMVAAALQAAHKEMIANLPTDAGIPVGWRFMDKFVQLPFIVPPADQTDLDRYFRTLLATKEVTIPEEVKGKLQAALAAAPVERADPGVVVARITKDANLNPAQTAVVTEAAEQHRTKTIIDEGIASFSDDNPEIQGLIKQAVRFFRGNPREMKRFLNLFRFHYFLMFARGTKDKPTPEQLLRWTVLCIRWPDVVRWLRRTGGVGAAAASASGLSPQEGSVFGRLSLLEQKGPQTASLKDWQETFQTVGLDPEKTAWLRDEAVRLFFQEEGRLPEKERLSAGAGKGLW